MDAKIQPVMGVRDLVKIRAQIKELEAREKDLVAILKERGVGIYSEDDYLAVVSAQTRSSVNLEGLRAKYPQQVEEFTGTTEYLMVRTMQRN